MDGDQKQKFLFYLFSVFALVCPSWVMAYNNSVNNEWYSSARALSMGNAAIAAAEDPATAMFYNPAALAITKKLEIEIFSPQFEFSMDNFVVGSGLRDQGKLISLNKAIPLLSRKPLKNTQLGFSLYPNLAAKNFAFGILLSMEGGAYVDPQGILHYHSQYLLVPTVGFSVGFLSGLFKLGLAGRMIQVTSNNKTTTNFTGVGYKNNAGQGLGFGLDAGTLLILPFATLPTFAAVARNIGGTNLSTKAIYSFGEGALQSLGLVKMTFDGGFSVAPKVGQNSVLKFAVDYRDISDATKADTWRKVNAGLELGLNRRVFFRAGDSAGYWSAGFGISGKYASMDIGTYGAELDPVKYRLHEDRRIVVRLGGKF